MDLLTQEIMTGLNISKVEAEEVIDEMWSEGFDFSGASNAQIMRQARRTRDDLGFFAGFKGVAITLDMLA